MVWLYILIWILILPLFLDLVNTFPKQSAAIYICLCIYPVYQGAALSSDYWYNQIGTIHKQ